LDVAAMTQLKHSIAGSIASPTDSFEAALADSMTHSCVSLDRSVRQGNRSQLASCRSSSTTACGMHRRLHSSPWIP
jgi:hypothetical protein